MKRPNRSEAKGMETSACHCPFCDHSMDMPYPFCQACGAEIAYCPECGQALPKGAEDCPHCAEGK